MFYLLKIYWSLIFFPHKSFLSFFIKILLAAFSELLSTFCLSFSFLFFFLPQFLNVLLVKAEAGSCQQLSWDEQTAGSFHLAWAGSYSRREGHQVREAAGLERPWEQPLIILSGTAVHRMLPGQQMFAGLASPDGLSPDGWNLPV